MSLFGLPETTEELSFFKLQICGNISPGVSWALKCTLLVYKNYFDLLIKINKNIVITVWLRPETTEELSPSKLQICGNIFPWCFLGTKMQIIVLD